MSKYHWIYTTWPDREAAEAAAEALVQERMVACANIFDGTTSIYEWEGKVVRDTETIMVLKTARPDMPALHERLRNLHTHAVPCIISLPIEVEHSAADYLSWLADQSN